MTVGSKALSFKSLLDSLRNYESVDQKRLTVSGDGELLFQELCHLVDMRLMLVAWHLLGFLAKSAVRESKFTKNNMQHLLFSHAEAASASRLVDPCEFFLSRPKGGY